MVIGPNVGDRRVVLDDADRAGADEVLVGVLQRQGEADRHDHHLGQAEATTSQRLPEHPVLEVAGEGAEQDDQDPADDQAESVHVDQEVAEHAAERDLLGVREVREPGGAVDQRETDRGESQQQAEPQPVDAALEQLVELAGRRAVVLGADRQQGRHGRAELGLDRHLTGVDDQVLRQRGLVDLDDVRALVVDLDVPLAGVAGRDLLGLTGLVGDRDGHVGQDTVLGADRAGDAGLVRAREAQGVDGARRARREHHQEGGEQQRENESRRPPAHGPFTDNVSRLQVGPPIPNPRRVRRAV